LGTISPIELVFDGIGYSGLALSFDANAPVDSSADITWSYNVVDFNSTISSAYLEMRGATTGIGSALISEQFGVTTFGRNNPGIATRSITPTVSLFVTTDNFDTVLGFFPGSSASSNLIINAFGPSPEALAAVPGPVAGSGILGLLLALGGLIRHRRRANRPIPGAEEPVMRV